MAEEQEEKKKIKASELFILTEADSASISSYLMKKDELDNYRNDKTIEDIYWNKAEKSNVSVAAVRDDNVVTEWGL